MPQFYTVPTAVGEAKIANAIALGGTINITQLAIGDGNGTLPTPDSDRAALVNEVRRGAINTSDVDADNPNWIVVEQVLPPDVGGWTIREVGIYDEDDDLIAYGNYPETYKPVLSEGSGRTQTIRFVMQVSSTAAITLKVDPAVVLATRKYADTQREEHEASRDHPAATTAAQGMVELANAGEVRSADPTRAVTGDALKKSGLLGGAVTTVTGVSTGTAHTLTAAEAGLVLVDAASGTVTLNLPAASGNGGLRYDIVRIDSSANTVSVAVDGTDTIDDAASLTVAAADRRELVCDGTSVWRRPEPVATESEPGMLPLASAADAQRLISLTKLLSPGRLADAFKGGNQSLTPNGFQVVPGGNIRQWGEIVIDLPSGVTTSKEIAFPIAFPTEMLSIGFSVLTNTPADLQCGFVPIDETSFTFWARSALNTTGQKFRFICEGH
jgi:hypothetical protein|tara:strand:- start:3831 stop:5153 length:1323 start_codon:yes stop_codon:yes gene_type:complete